MSQKTLVQPPRPETKPGEDVYSYVSIGLFIETSPAGGRPEDFSANL